MDIAAMLLGMMMCKSTFCVVLQGHGKPKMAHTKHFLQQLRRVRTFRLAVTFFRSARTRYWTHDVAYVTIVEKFNNLECETFFCCDSVLCRVGPLIRLPESARWSFLRGVSDYTT